MVSVLDRSLLDNGGTLLLGRADISLETPPDADVEAWHPLSAGGAGAGQFAGSVKVRQRFVPEAHWAEYLRAAAGMESAEDDVPACDVETDVCGLYVLVLGAAGCAGDPVLPGRAVRMALECGGRLQETAALPLAPEITFLHSSGGELIWERVGARGDLRVELVYCDQGGDSEALEERPAAAALRMDRFPFDEVHEAEHALEPGPATPHGFRPRVRLAVYRTIAVRADATGAPSAVCLGCGTELPHAFHAPHLAVACPGYVLPCPHQAVGCQWSGPRADLGKHLLACGFEQSRQDIYGGGTRGLRGVEELLAAVETAALRRGKDATDNLYTKALLPRHVKTFRGHKHAVHGLAGISSARRLASADSSGVIKLWELELDEEVDHVRAHGAEVACLHYSDAFPALCFSGGGYPDDTLKVAILLFRIVYPPRHLPFAAFIGFPSWASLSHKIIANSVKLRS